MYQYIYAQKRVKKERNKKALNEESYPEFLILFLLMGFKPLIIWHFCLLFYHTAYELLVQT